MNAKNHSSALIILVISTFYFLFSIPAGYAQANISGSWEGPFMNDFLMKVSLSVDESLGFKGTIRMYAGDNLIQDDPLKDIYLNQKDLKFYIPAKETWFEGSFNDPLSELTGEFAFPDGSKHPVELKRKRTEVIRVKEFKSLKEKKYDPKDLRSDLLFLYTTLKEQHPQPYAFSSKDVFDQRFKKINNSINSPLNLEEFYLKASMLSDAVNCSHTGVKLPSSYQKLINEYGRFFPLRLFFKSGKAYYISGASEKNKRIAPGNEIMSIDKEPISEIIQRIFYFIPSEGCHTTTKYNEINKRFNALFYYLDDSDEFVVKFKTGDSIESVTVESSEFSTQNLDERTAENVKQVDFNYTGNKSVAVLKAASFAIPEMDAYFKQLDSIFLDLKTKNIQNLVIDLRDNSGGHPIFAAQLLSYLTDKEFIYFKRNEEIKDFEPLYQTMPPNKLNFDGDLYVLVNGGCLSTAGHLISLIKFYTNAIFIGEEPGSTFRCNDFSSQMTLPNSGIEINIPRTTFETAVSGYSLCEPFPLDHEVNTDVIDLINQKDAYMEMVKTITKK